MSESVRNERSLLAGIFATHLGNAMQVLLVGKFLFDLTGSAKAFGGAIAFEQGFGLIATYLAGPLVDRWNPFKTLIATDLIRGLMVMLAGIWTLIQPAVWPVYWMIFFVQLGRPFYKSGLFVAETEWIRLERLAIYNSRSVAAMQIGSFIGIWIAGWLISIRWIQMGFIINGLTFLISAWSFNRPNTFRVSQQVPLSSRGYFSEWKVVFEMMAKHKRMGFATFLSAFDFALPNLFNLILAPLVFLKLRDEPVWLSILDSFFAAGAAIAGLTMGWIVTKRGIRFGVFHGLLMQMIGLWLLYYSSSGAWLSIGAALFGFANTVSWTAWQTWMQKNVTKAQRGKVILIRHMISSAVTSLLAIGVGVVLEKALGMAILLTVASAFFALVMSEIFFSSQESTDGNQNQLS